jgi:basic membrane lipoprotein Med (substrate-binding protein (PBP1-ABC) superfamily)
MKKARILITLIGLLAFLISACAPAATSAPATQPPAAAEQPKELKIAIISTTPKEEPWNTVLLQAVERVIAKKPHGLNITYDFQELVDTPDGERVMGELANSGEYGIIWGHSVYPDAIQALGPKYRDIAFVGGGSGYEPMKDNMYWVNMFVHESAYLNGIIAGKMTKSNIIGAVAGYPYENVNMPINAFFDGARSVNPNIQTKMAYIDSWYDPPKAKEAALAQIAAGADYIYAERFGPFEAATEKGAFAFGHYMDQNELAPNTVVNSALALWDPAVEAIIDAWWEHTVNGKPYSAPTTDAMYFLMKDGGTDIAPYHGFDSKIPQDVKDLVEQTRQKILSGELEIKPNGAQVDSSD